MKKGCLMNPVHIYNLLLKRFGRQYWWPGETRFEVIVGAFLTQQTNWRNVEVAIKNLKDNELLNPYSLANAPVCQVEGLIRQSGFFRQKTRRIKLFSQYLVDNYDGSLDKLFTGSQEKIRKELLSLKGVGPETADSILLYAANKLNFPVDAYTIRVCDRLGVKELEYEKLAEFFESNLPRDLEIYKELHALLDVAGKTFCKTEPLCSGCPLTSECKFND